MCETAPLNTMMQKQIGANSADEDGATFHCLEFLLTRIAAVEVNVRFDSNVYSNNSILVRIKSAESVKMTSPVEHFSE